MKLNIQLFGAGEIIIPVLLQDDDFMDDLKILKNKLSQEDFDVAIKPKIEEKTKQVFDNKINELMEKMQEYRKTANAPIQFGNISTQSLKELKGEIDDIVKELEQLTGEKIRLPEFEKMNTEKPKRDFKEIGKELSKITSKVAKWGLGLIGVRTAVSGIRSAISLVSGNNEKIAGQLATMKMAISNALVPVVQKVVQIVAKIMQMVDYVYFLITGKHLFDFSKAFKDAQKSAKGTTKAVKEIAKTIAGFDEMNILNNNQNTGAGRGGNVGATAYKIPETDISSFKKVADKIKEAWDEILEIDRNEAKKLFEQSDSAWGSLYFAIFDWTQGWVKIFQGAFDTIGGIWDILVGWANDDDKKIQDGVAKVKKGIIRILEGLGQVLIAPWEMLWGYVKGIAGTIWNWIKKKLIDPIVEKIDGIKKKLKENFKDGFWKGLLNTAIDVINKVIGKINDKLTISISGTLAKILKALGVNVSAGKYSLFTIPKIPKLAQGGIINMPGRGIPVGGAIAGERGTEGVIPLTDSQQMALLGEAIGKYITINANITNTMNGRVISRELQKIQQESSFASNR